MKNVMIYCELDDKGQVVEVSLELCTKGREIANKLGVKLEAAILGANLAGVEKQVLPYGVDTVMVADDARLAPYRTLPHFAVLSGLIKDEQPDIVLFGATHVGRDLGPHVASYLRCGLTADCTSLEIGDHEDPKTGTKYENILYQIRPAFGGNIIATIVCPTARPQMATVRRGVMKREVLDANYQGQRIDIDVAKYLKDSDCCVKILQKEVVEKTVDLGGASIILSGGYGMGSKEGFDMLYDFARQIGAEVGATRAAVDAGWAAPERQIGQTGTTVRPKLYIACGISGAIQHRAGMDQSAKIISINTDPEAPINAIADYTIIGDVMEVLPMLAAGYKNIR